MSAGGSGGGVEVGGGGIKCEALPCHSIVVGWC